MFPTLTFESFSQQIKHTPRNYNSALNVMFHLQTITWVLNTNVNIIGFKRTKNYTKCKTHSNCSFAYYIFQNPLIKLVTSAHTITVICYKNKYYIHKPNRIVPLLINLKPHFAITYNSHCLSRDNIIAILKKEPIELPFNIQIYSTYKYIREEHVKSIQQNNIGSLYNKNNTETIHIFVSPNLDNTCVHLNILNNINNTMVLKNPFFVPTTYLPETQNIKEFSKEINPQKTLNQNHCICEHPCTARYFNPTNKSYKNLGKNIYNV